MCKKADLAIYQNLFKDIMNRGYGTLDELRKEVQKIYDANKDEAQEDWSDDTKKSVYQISLASIIVNDIIHFGHEQAKTLFPEENKPFIEHAIQKQQEAVDRGSVVCTCCKPTEEITPEVVTPDV